MTLELECIDRMYLNGYQPDLQGEQRVFRFLREQRDQLRADPLPSNIVKTNYTLSACLRMTGSRLGVMHRKGIWTRRPRKFTSA